MSSPSPSVARGETFSNSSALTLRSRGVSAPAREADDRSVLGRAFRILGAFTCERPRLTLSEVSRRTDIPLATVHRLINQLLDNDAMVRNSDSTYELGVRIWEMGALAPRAHGLRQIALPYLEDLYEATHQNVQLILREGAEALCIERIAGHRSVPVVSRAGGRLPLHASAGGLVVLAHSGSSVVDRVVQQGFESFTPHTITTEERLNDVLRRIRRDGSVVCREHLSLGSVSVATPIRAASGQVMAAISVVLDVRHDPTPLIPALRAASHGISRRLPRN